MAGQAPNQASGESNAKPAKAWTGKLLVAGFMGGVVAVECLVAYLMFPSPEEVAALAQKDLERKLPANLTADDPTLVGKETKEVVEVDLGEYSITVTQPNASTALRVDFQLWGTVLEGDQNVLTSLLDRNVHRFRDQVLYEIRNSESSDLADPGLALIKRRILE